MFHLRRGVSLTEGTAVEESDPEWGDPVNVERLLSKAGNPSGRGHRTHWAGKGRGCKGVGLKKKTFTPPIFAQKPSLSPGGKGSL